MLWWQLAIVALAGGSALWFQLVENSRHLRAWQEAVTACGLRVVDISRISKLHLRLTARAGPVEVQIDTRRHGIRVVVLVQGPPGYDGMRIRRELHKPPGAREIELGDEAFDSTFFIEGPARVVSMLLDGEARRLLLDANSISEVEVAGGAVRMEIMTSQLGRILPLLLALGQRWTGRMDAAQRFPEAGVRLWNLLLLIRELPGSHQTAAALQTARTDPSPRVRLRAAIELGTKGRDLLHALAADPEEDDASAQAVLLLGRDLPFERARATLIQSLRRRHLQTARACLQALGVCGNPAAVDTLAKVMAREKGELAVAAAVALGVTGAAAAEPALLQALQSDRADLRVAAATSLVRAGTAAAVLPLKEAAELRDRDLRRAARQAVAEIQSRLQGASPGQLSLAGDGAGQLSLAPGEAGQLSLPTESGGQLSLPPDRLPSR
jgi:hypothetical protein